MTINYDKQFKTYDEQINYLIQEHNLIIKDRNFAKILLSTISYYDLINGYKECFMVDEKFIDNMSIEELYSFYMFDLNFQNILFKYSVIIENRFKTNLAYVLSQDFGVDHTIYLNKNNFVNQKRILGLINKINKNLDSKNFINPTKHYLKNKNHVPAWILFKNLSFNDSIDIFKHLKLESREKVVNLLLRDSIDKDYIQEFSLNSIIIIRKFRNSIAHKLKFITFRTFNSTTKKGNQIILKNLSKKCIGNLIETNDFKTKRGACDPFSMIICISALLHNPEFIKRFYEDLSREIIILENKTDGINIFKKYCNITNIPTNIKSRFQRHLDSLYQL